MFESFQKNKVLDTETSEENRSDSKSNTERSQGNERESETSYESAFLEGIEDKFTEYLHVIISSHNDECSYASIEDVTRLSFLLMKIAPNYKTACISLNAKGNETLRTNLI